MIDEILVKVFLFGQKAPLKRNSNVFFDKMNDDPLLNGGGYNYFPFRSEILTIKNLIKRHLPPSPTTLFDIYKRGWLDIDR